MFWHVKEPSSGSPLGCQHKALKMGCCIMSEFNHYRTLAQTNIHLDMPKNVWDLLSSVKHTNCVYSWLYIIIMHCTVHVCIYQVQNVFLRCPTPRLHCFLSSHWPSFRFLSFMAFFIPSIQFFFSLSRALFCFDIHFNAILGSHSSVILWTWPCHMTCFCSISFIIVSSSQMCCLVIIFLILSFLDILEDLLRTSISVASTRLLLFSVSLHVSEPYNKLLLISAL